MADFPNAQNNAAGAIPAWITDPLTGYYIKPNADGSLNVSGISGATLVQSQLQATAAAPTYLEGTPNFQSGDLAGNLRTRNIPDATLLDGDNVLTVHSVAVTASATGATQVVAADATHKIRVVGYVLTANGNVDVKFQSDTTDLTGLSYFGQHTNIVAPLTPSGWFQTAANKPLNINLGQNIAVGGHLLYVLVP